MMEELKIHDYVYVGNRAPEGGDVSHTAMHRKRVTRQSLLELETMRGDAVAEEVARRFANSGLRTKVRARHLVPTASWATPIWQTMKKCRLTWFAETARLPIYLYEQYTACSEQA